MTGSRSSSILSTARSESGSVPITLALAWRPSLRMTSMSSALSTTWLLVRIKPLALTITPLPRPTWGSLPCSPKKKLNQGSLLCGFLRATLLVLMLTTAADAFCAASLKLPVGAAPSGPEGATCKPSGLVRCRDSTGQSGFKVLTTKRAASKTVTVWANNNQRRFMDRIQARGLPSK